MAGLSRRTLSHSDRGRSPQARYTAVYLRKDQTHVFASALQSTRPAMHSFFFFFLLYWLVLLYCDKTEMLSTEMSLRLQASERADKSTDDKPQVIGYP